MKDTKTVVWPQKKTDPLLLKAKNVLSAYTKSTGAQSCVMDKNYLSIPEIFDEVNTEKNVCLYCMKHRLNLSVDKNKDFYFHPCREMHIKNMMNAHKSGGSCVYSCELGFNFWTSPIYSGRRFIGALIGGGFLCNEPQETVEKMLAMGDGSESREELLERLKSFPQVDPQHIESLAELLLNCAEFLSKDMGNYHEELRRKLFQQSEISGELEKMKEKYPYDHPAPEYPLGIEKTLLEAVRRGDAAEAFRSLNQLVSMILFAHPDEFKHIQLRVLELAVLLSRMENTSMGLCSAFPGIAHQFIKPMEEAGDSEDLIDTLHLMIRHLAEQSASFQKTRHFSSMKRAEQFIRSNFTRKISLKEIAAASGLSAPYFSTIFRKEMGENLSIYLNRLRVEKASQLLAETNLPLGEISGLSGFEDKSWFSKIFKSYTGINPAKFRQMKKNPPPEIPESDLSEKYRKLVTS